MNRIQARVLLERQAEENYKKFNDKLIPGVKNTLGVRMVSLKEDKEYLNTLKRKKAVQN